MARVVVLGAGVSGHTAALYLKKRLGKAHEVVVDSPNSQYNWIPSNIWVGVGKMTTDDVVFPLAPIYAKKDIRFVQAKAFALWPEGDGDDDRAAVEVEHTSPEKAGQTEKLRYDYVIKPRGPSSISARPLVLARTLGTQCPCAPRRTPPRRTLSSRRSSRPASLERPSGSLSAWATARARARVRLLNTPSTVSYTHLRAHETKANLVCRL